MKMEKCGLESCSSVWGPVLGFHEKSIFGLHKTCVISWIAEKLLIIHGLCCVEVAKILNGNTQ